MRKIEAEINRIAYMICCPMCDNDKCCRGTDKCDAVKWRKRKLEELQEERKVKTWTQV